MSPTRAFCSSVLNPGPVGSMPLGALEYTKRHPRRVLRPVRVTSEKSVEFDIRCRRGNILGQALTRLRPLALRALTIERPARVRILSRKPCFLDRRRLFG